MSEMRSLVERHYAQVAAGDWQAAAEIFSPDLETIEPGAGTMRGLEAFQGYLQVFRAAFPDGRLVLKAAVEAGDTIAVEGSFTGTHNGPLAGPAGTIPPTGRKLDLPYADFFRIRNGRIVSHHVYYDQVGFLTQLGLMSGPASADA